MKSFRRTLISLVLPAALALALLSCSPGGVKPQEEAGPGSRVLSPAEQDKKALELFEQIAEVYSGTDRITAAPKAEVMYLKIINEYPEAALGQECYQLLLRMYTRDFNPPDLEKAGQYYQRFLKKYPGSQLKNEMETMVSKAYYLAGRWDKILELYAPAVKRYIETGKLQRPQDMFLYAEAKLNLGDQAEAEKGYKIVVSLFPSTREGSVSKTRLDELAARNKIKK